MKTMLLVMILMAAANPCIAATTTPMPDARIRTVEYAPDQVITVPVSTGVVTRVVLEPGEKIIAAATGVPSKCDNDQHLWCVVADANANEVWIKPKAGAHHNNLELKTDRRNYSFEFIVGTTTTYRVSLRYPATKKPDGTPAPGDQDIVAKRIAQTAPQPRNLHYTLESNHRGADITPKAIFDDGNFTYFKFPGNSEVPTIFVIGSDGKEARTNFNMSGDYVVVQRLAHKFVLRLGKAVVSVWNESFDQTGAPPVNGTTVPGVAREIIGDGQ